MRERVQAAAAFSGVALALAGCASGEDNANVTPSAAKTTTAPSATIRGADRGARSSHAAPPVKEGSAAAVALTFVRDLRDGAGPVLLPYYDSRVRQRVGLSNVIGALEQGRQTTLNTTPVFVRQRRVNSGELVVWRLVHQRSEGGAKPEDSKYAFLFRRQGGRWVIAYDSLLAEGLRAHVQAAKAKKPSTPSKAAVKAGERAVLELKLAARSPLARSNPATKKTPKQNTPAAP